MITQGYPGKDDRKKECEEYFLLTGNVQDMDKFDVFGVSQLFFWKMVGILRQVKRVDERQKKFVSVTNWSTNFSLLEKNDKPVRI